MSIVWIGAPVALAVALAAALRNRLRRKAKKDEAPIFLDFEGGSVFLLDPPMNMRHRHHHTAPSPTAAHVDYAPPRRGAYALLPLPPPPPPPPQRYDAPTYAAPHQPPRPTSLGPPPLPRPGEPPQQQQQRRRQQQQQQQKQQQAPRRRDEARPPAGGHQPRLFHEVRPGAADPPIPRQYSDAAAANPGVPKFDPTPHRQRMPLLEPPPAPVILMGGQSPQPAALHPVPIPPPRPVLIQQPPVSLQQQQQARPPPPPFVPRAPLQQPAPRRPAEPAPRRVDNKRLDSAPLPRVDENAAAAMMMRPVALARRPAEAPAANAAADATNPGAPAPAPAAAEEQPPDETDIDLAELTFVGDGAIGGGAFGTVRRAKFRGTDVAVKLLANASINAAAFKSEARNVCMFMGASFGGRQCAIVTELMDGSLWDALHDPRTQWPLHRQARVALGIARGCVSADARGRLKEDWFSPKRLAYLHAHTPPVLHRDIKSPNVLVDREIFTVKLCDVGLAREANGNATSAAMTVGCGTPQWMAPEVLSAQPYGERADVFSFAIVLAELGTRTCPYAEHVHLQGVALAMRVVHENLRPALPPDWPLANLARKCWAPAPRDRPPIADALPFLDDLLVQQTST